MTTTASLREQEESFHQLRQEAELAVKLALIQVQRAENRAPYGSPIEPGLRDGLGQFLDRVREAGDGLGEVIDGLLRVAVGEASGGVSVGSGGPGEALDLAEGAHSGIVEASSDSGSAVAS